MKNQKILTGFIVKGASSVPELEIVINQMKNVVQTVAEMEYERLLTMEIERAVDMIAMNQMKRPENFSLLEAAARLTRNRILYSDRNGCETEYNLYIGCQVLVGKFETPKENSILLKIIAPNDIYLKPLKQIKALVPYTVYSDEVKEKGPKEKLWNELCKQYPRDVPLASNLIDYDVLSVDPREFKYHTVEERAAVYARESVLNKLVSQYACGEQVEPQKLMEYIKKAENRIHYEDLQNEVEQRKNELLSILPNITYSLVSKSPIISRLDNHPDTADDSQPKASSERTDQQRAAKESDSVVDGNKDTTSSERSSTVE